MSFPQSLGYALVAIGFGLLAWLGWVFVSASGAPQPATGVTEVSESAESPTERPPSFTDTEAGFGDDPVVPEYRIGGGLSYTLEELATWERPAGPLRVGLQVGHLNNAEVPEELSNLTRNGAGAVAAGFNERDTVEVITELAAERLRAEGITVDVLPAVVPPGYVADAFVSVHADGNTNTSVRGWKIAGPRRDYSGRSEALVAALSEAYDTATPLPLDPNISRRMTAYYAFNWARFEHAIHPFTPAAIVETGFLTNPTDRAFLINQPQVAADAIAEGILTYLENIPEPLPPPGSLSAPALPLEGVVECAPVRPERRDRDARPCEAALRDDEGYHYLLISEPPLATSTLPYRATVNGQYVPVQVLDNYFWFHWDVRGMIMVDSIE